MKKEVELMKHFVGIVGGTNVGSTNRKLLQYMAQHFASEAEIELVEIGNLPVFNKPQNKVLPSAVLPLVEKIEQADGVIISTPEYDHSAPAALMNVLNWLSYGVYPFVDKPVMITGCSYGTLGSSRAQAHLRQMLDAPELKARIMPSSEFLLGHSLAAFDDQGQLQDAEQVQRLTGLFHDFCLFVDITKQLTETLEADKVAAANFDWKKGSAS